MMKKIIALALALSMALSMVAFAGYTDAALINEDLTADVDLVKALGLMTGNPDGSFNPQGTLTRGEAAVIIYRLKSGKTDIDASWGDASLNTFTDMADHWSAKYVNYCAALGLITGNPDGTFRPDNAVTGVEMAKMLLNVAGYDTEKQQYGPKWPAAVLADAGDSGLLNGYEAAFTAPAPREWVAAMVANLLDVQTVSYNAYTNALVKNTKNDEPVLFGEQYGVKSVDAYVFANKNTAMLTGAKEAEVSTVYMPRGSSNKVDIDFDIPNELVGHNVKVYFKGSTLTSDSKVYAVMDNAKKVVTTTIDKVTLSSAGVLKADGVELDDEATTVKYWSSNKTASKFIGSTAKRDSREVTLVQNGTTWDLFTTDTVYTKVTKNDAEATTFTTEGGYGNTTDEEVYGEIVFNDEVAKDDIVCVETLADGTVVVSKVNALRTKVTSVSGSNFVAAGTTYKPAENLTKASALSNDALPTDENGIKNNTYDVYTDGKYYVYLDQYSGDSANVPGLDLNVVYLINGAAGNEGNTFEAAVADKVQVMFSDGTIAIYEYDGSSTAIDFAFDNGTNAGTIYEYVLNEDGTISFYAATATPDAEGATVAVIDKDHAPSKYTVKTSLSKSFLTVNSAPVYANENSFFFVKQTYTPDGETEAVTKYSVVKASEIEATIEGNGWTFGAQTAYTLDKTGFNTLAYGVLVGTTEKLPVASDTGSLFIATATATETLTAEGKTWSVKGINAQGAVETITLDYELANKTGSAIAKGQAYVVKTEGGETYLATLSVDKDGTYSKSAWNQATIDAATDKLIVLADGEMRDLKDVNIISVNVKWSSTDTDKDGNTTNDRDDATYAVGTNPEDIPHTAKNVLVKLDSSGKVTDIVLAYEYNTVDKDYEDQIDVSVALAY